MKQFVEQNKINPELTKDLVLVLDFHVEAGRESEAIDYFQKPDK